MLVKQEAEKALKLIARDYRMKYTTAEALLARKNELAD
jgi:hypothetical protein